METTREARERELWKLAQTPAGMLELERLYDDLTGSENPVREKNATQDVGPMIARILESEFVDAARPSR